MSGSVKWISERPLRCRCGNRHKVVTQNPKTVKVVSCMRCFSFNSVPASTQWMRL